MNTIPQTRTSANDLAAQLVNLAPGTTAINFTALTVPAQRRGGPYYPIAKLSRINGLLGFADHGDDQGDACGGDKPAWHEPVRISGHLTDLCRHKVTGELYLRVRVVRSLTKPRYFAGDGAELAVEEALPWLRPTRDEGEPVVFRTYKLSSIVSIACRRLAA